MATKRRYVSRLTIHRVEDVPSDVPKREISSAGYVWLVWKVGYYAYVRCYEHRLILGFPKGHVHHKNGNKADNRPDNLQPFDPGQHIKHHGFPGHNKMLMNETKIRELFEAGLGVPAIAGALGCSTMPVQRVLRQLKLKRPCGRVPRAIGGTELWAKTNGWPESKPGSQREDV